MSDKTGIEWTDSTWNPVTGCTEVSPGCDHCYAKTFAERWRGTPGHYFENGFDVQLRPDKLDQPLKWRKPRRIFVNSMSDLFHDGVPDEYIAKVFAIMAVAHRHTFQVLTKRHARMRSLLSRSDFRDLMFHSSPVFEDGNGGDSAGDWIRSESPSPLPNVWIGVSAENQQWADIRIPALLDTPAAVRFVSAEPLLGPIDLSRWITQSGALRSYGGHYNMCNGAGGSCFTTWCTCPCHELAFDRLHWVIVGGESGPGARPMHPWWAESLHRQCEKAGVPFLFKQWGAWTPMAPLVDGKFDFRNGVAMTDDGNTYAAGELTWPDGARWGEALRADFPHHRPTSMYRVGKHKAGRELYHDGRTFDGYPESVAA